MKPTEVVKRYLLFIVSLLFAAFGVAVTKHAELGVSPISSTANVLSCKFTALSLGVWLILWNCVLILGQILILRRQFQPIQLLQLPLSLLFGWFTDLGMACVAAIPVPNYPVRLLLVLCGIILLGFGISLSVIANVILNSGEAFVTAISDVSGKNFGDLPGGDHSHRPADGAGGKTLCPPAAVAAGAPAQWQCPANLSLNRSESLCLNFSCPSPSCSPRF